jgi:hypothetical protein
MVFIVTQQKEDAMFKVEKGLPIPARVGEIEAFLKTLEVGDSFDLDGKSFGSVYQQAYKIGVKLTRRKNRVWRKA